MELTSLVDFARRQQWAVEASVADDGVPQAAVIGVAVTDRLEIVFDTESDSRKARNLRRRPRVALVIGWDEAQTLQLEGVVDEPTGPALEELVSIYFERFPDGRERAAAGGITYFRVRPKWARYSDFRGAAPVVIDASNVLPVV
jgi:general stress protein 26